MKSFFLSQVNLGLHFVPWETIGSSTNTWLKEENLEDQVLAQIQGSDKTEMLMAMNIFSEINNFQY